MVLQTQTRNSEHPVTGAKDGASPSRSGGAGLEGRKPERDPCPGGSVRLPAPGEPAVDKGGSWEAGSILAGSTPAQDRHAAASLSVHSACFVIRARSGFWAS